jgi:putative transposase
MIKQLVTNVEKQHRALKLRIYPNSEQEILINKTFGCCRQIYNNRLFERNQFYETVIKPETDKKKQKELWKTIKLSTEKEMGEKFPYLKEVSSQALQQARRDSETAYKNFFESLKGKRAGSKVGSPKFKSKKSNDFSYRECVVSKTALKWNERKVRVPKLGEVKFRHSGNKKGKLDFFLVQGAELKSITIRKNPAGEYFAILLYEREYCSKKKSFDNSENQAIGLDFSPADFYIDSNSKSGKNFGYIAQKQKNLKKLTKLQRRLARKQKGSKNREKARIKVARMEHYIAECRNDWIEKESLRLVQNYQVIGIEDLNIKGMMKFSRNAKNYGDASWGTFVNKLLWKSSKNENNCQIVKADKFFASSQICHCCGYKNLITKDLSIREWTCPNCGEHHIRDVNAALNLKENAIKTVRQGVSEVSKKSVESVEGLAMLALQAGAFDETENLTGDGQNVFTHKYVKG